MPNNIKKECEEIEAGLVKSNTQKSTIMKNSRPQWIT